MTTICCEDLKSYLQFVAMDSADTYKAQIHVHRSFLIIKIHLEIKFKIRIQHMNNGTKTISCYQVGYSCLYQRRFLAKELDAPEPWIALSVEYTATNLEERPSVEHYGSWDSRLTFFEGYSSVFTESRM